jgi:hypothetical protein
MAAMIPAVISTGISLIPSLIDFIKGVKNNVSVDDKQRIESLLRDSIGDRRTQDLIRKYDKFKRGGQYVAEAYNRYSP